MVRVEVPKIDADKNGDPEKILVNIALETGTCTLTIEKLNETEVSVRMMYPDGFEQEIELIIDPADEPVEGEEN